jgi:hypothetical protein
MRIKAYLRVLGDQVTIGAIHQQAYVGDASVKEPKARKRPTSNECWWNWETQHSNIDVDQPDEGLQELLFRYKPIAPILNKFCGPEVDVYLEVVTEYQQGEPPRGLYLSRETISLLSEFGAALDNDVVVHG